MSNTEDPIITQYEAQLSAAVVPDYFLPEQFCNSGTQTTDYVIPPKTSADPAAASLDTGAPPLQQVKPSLGGAVFPRQQYNGILRLLSNLLAYLNKGNNFTYDTKNTDGYALGAVLFDYNSNKWVVSLKNANTNNFVTNPNLIDGVNWQFITVNPTGANNFTQSPTVPTPVITDTTTKVANMAAINQAVTGYASIDVSTAVGGILTITEAQYRLQWLAFSGTLTSDLIIDIPGGFGKTIALLNNVMMGSYSINVRRVGYGAVMPLPSGCSLWVFNASSGISYLSSLYNTTLYGNSYYNYDIGSNDNSYRLANTAFVQTLAALMGKLAGNNVWSAQNTFTKYVLSNAQVIGTSPNNGNTGALVMRDAIGNPNAVYLQATNNAGTIGYGYLKFNADGTITPSGIINGQTSTSFGVGQTWQDVTASRNLNITYTNTTQKPIEVIVQSTGTGATNSAMYPRVNGIDLSGNAPATAGQVFSVCFIVPPGQTYYVLASGATYNRWSELR